MNAIHDLKVLHCDAMPRNILWHKESGGFERSKLQQQQNDGGKRKKPLKIISPNKSSLRALPAADTKTDVIRKIVDVREEDFVQEVRRAVSFTAHLLCALQWGGFLFVFVDCAAQAHDRRSPNKGYPHVVRGHGARD